MQHVYGAYRKAAQALVLAVFFGGAALSAQAQNYSELVKSTGPVDGQLLALQNHYESFFGPGEFTTDNALMRVSDGYVVVDAVADGNTDALMADLKRLGMQKATVYGAYVSGRMPISSLRAMNSLKSLRAVRPAAAKTSVGLTTSQGVQAMYADDVQNNLGITGIRVELIPSAPRHLLVRHVFAQSPADGIVQVGDVLTGAGGQAFQAPHRNGYGTTVFGGHGPISEFATALEAAAKAETDTKKRTEMYQRMQDIMEESGAYRFLTHEATPVIYNKSIKPAFRPDGLPLLRYFRPA